MTAPLAGARADASATTTRAVVDGLDLVVPRERITAVVGANGCGKSTLLRALARLLTPARGRRAARRARDPRAAARARSRGGSGCCRSRRSRRTA